MNSEEQYKHIEQKIVEAASQNEYPFTEEAWKRMELLLDKKDKKRRYFFWVLPLLLLLSIGGGIIMYNNANKSNPIIAHQQKIVDTKTEQTQSLTKEPTSSNQPELNESLENASTKKVISESALNSTSIDTEVLQTQQTNSLPKQSGTQNFYQESVNKPVSNKRKFNKTSYSKEEQSDDEELNAKHNKKYKKNSKATIKITTPALGEENWDKTKAISEEVIEEKQVVEAAPQLPNLPKAEDEKENEVKNASNENEKKSTAKQVTSDKKKKQKNAHFFITASLGAEANTTKLLSFNNTTIVPRYGAAIGYQFNNRLSAQAGFYVSGKKYVAKQSEYKFAPNSYWTYVDIAKIDANCKVYEIPLSVQYNFISKPKLNVFGSAGISSYIMKKEDYVYNYWYNNVFYSVPSSYTKNTHLLAAAIFSIGIEKSIAKKIALQFAPRISVPLGGVGQGEVKLFSSGIDFGVKYYPFKK